jgi:hypothetical protein
MTSLSGGRGLHDFPKGPKLRSVESDPNQLLGPHAAYIAPVQAVGRRGGGLCQDELTLDGEDEHTRFSRRTRGWLGGRW